MESRTAGRAAHRRLRAVAAHLAPAAGGGDSSPSVQPRLEVVGWAVKEAQGMAEQPVELSERDKFLFDLNGWLEIPGALGPAELAALNASLDRNWSRRTLGAESTKRRGYDQFHDMLIWERPDSDPWRALLCHPPLIAALNTVLGMGWKMDGEPFVLTAQPGQVPPDGKVGGGMFVHGPTSRFHDGPIYYKYANGVMQCGMVNVLYNLSDVEEGDGGFGIISGSVSLLPRGSLAALPGSP